MPIQALGPLGRATLEKAGSYFRMCVLFGLCLRSAFSPAFLNPAVWRVFIRQIYFTAVQALPVITLIALILGSITVHYMLSLFTGLGAYERIGEYLIKGMMNEIAPLACTLILLIRSGGAVITEVALMNLNRELNTLHLLDIPLANYVFLPRLAAFALSGVSLTFYFGFTAVIGGFFILGYIHDITFANYLDQLIAAFELESLFILIAKPLLMCTLIALTALDQGMQVQKSFTQVPVNLIKGMIRSTGMIILCELFFVFNL